MARELTANNKNKLTLQDQASSSNIVLYYRQPTAEEHIKFQSTVTKVVEGKIVYDEAARLDGALAILTGFEEGCLTVDGKPISSDEAAENYYPGWRPLVRETAADWLMILAMVAYEGARRVNTTPFQSS